MQLEALDDLPPRPGSFVEVQLGEAQDLPSLPPATVTFVARARAADGDLRMSGLLARDGDEAVGALFPVARACALTDAVGVATSFVPPDGAVFASSLRHTALAGGVGADGVARSDVLVLDGVRAEVHRLGLRRRRAGAAVVVTDDAVLVLGGEAEGTAWEDGERLELSTRPPSLRGDPLRLSEPRAHAGAVQLASGKVLLVGGGRGAGLLRAMELLDPDKGTASTLDVAALTVGRLDPVVVRLATGEVLVLGGRDAAGAAVADLERISADARTSERTALAARPLVTAMALPSGPALVVRGAPGDAQWEASLVGADGAIEALAPVDAGGAAPVLVPGTDGAPFLWDGTLRRYDPWKGRFVASDVPVLARPWSLGQGALGFVGPGGLSGARFDVRHRLTADETLGLGSTAHLAPHPRTVQALRTGLVLPGGARVAITDTDYGAFHLTVSVAGFRELPAIELRTPLGGLVVRIAEDGACRTPTAEGNALEVVRAVDGTLILRIGDTQTVCAAPAGRVAVSLVAPGREAVVRGLTLRRG